MKALAFRIALRVGKEGDQTVRAIAFNGDHQQTGCRAGESERCEMTQGGAADEEHRPRGQDDHECGAEIWFEHNETAHQAHHKDERHNTKSESLHRFALGRQPGRDVNNEGQLRELARLDRRQRSNGEPPVCPVAVDTDVGNEHNQQAGKRRKHDHRAPDFEDVIIKPGEEDEQQCAYCRARPLSHDEVVDVVVIRQPDRHARAVHRQQSQPHE